jgi:hypothetical protein
MRKNYVFKNKDGKVLSEIEADSTVKVEVENIIETIVDFHNTYCVIPLFFWQAAFLMSNQGYQVGACKLIADAVRQRMIPEPSYMDVERAVDNLDESIMEHK